MRSAEEVLDELEPVDRGDYGYGGWKPKMGAPSGHQILAHLRGQGLTVVPFSAISWLVQHNLNQLWSQSVDPEVLDSDGMQPCCPLCCGPCEALQTLLDSGQLDELAEPGKGTLADDAWWDFEKGQVSRDWLKSAWHPRDQCGDADHDHG